MCKTFFVNSNFLELCLKYVKHPSRNKRYIGTKKTVGIFLMTKSCGDKLSGALFEVCEASIWE